MKKLFLLALFSAITVLVSACANLSSTSPDAVNCKPGVSEQDKNPDCSPGR